MIRSDDQLQRILATGPIIVYTSSAFNYYVISYISNNVKSLLGLEPCRFLADPSFWISRIHYRDRVLLYKNLKRLQKGRHTLCEYRFRHADGKYRWLRDEARLVNDSSGAPVGIVGYCLDISERKWMEKVVGENVKLYGSVAELIADFFFKFSIETNGELFLEWMMGRFERISGYSMDKLGSAFKWQDIIYQSDLEKYEKFFQKIISGIPNECTLRIVTKKGGIKWLQICGKPEWDAQREFVNGITCAGKDITPRVEKEQRLLELTKYVAQKQFNGKIEEDIETILSAVRGPMHFLK